MKKNNVVSYRRDLFTYKKYEKNILYKFCIINKHFVFDQKQNLCGRSVYLNKENFSKANLYKVRQKISKAYKRSFSNESFNEFVNLIESVMKKEDE